ncbi:hypothetical protein [Methylocaldum sp. 14B]|uniref:hypothetical protein n=1 Tax=Methylocaldum sp. 14B TaxID=1912213 RepID=UPI00117E82F0|nr:hypothetical protein [Methylocaldum sp. 14B]
MKFKNTRRAFLSFCLFVEGVGVENDSGIRANRRIALIKGVFTPRRANSRKSTTYPRSLVLVEVDLPF